MTDEQILDSALVAVGDAPTDTEALARIACLLGRPSADRGPVIGTSESPRLLRPGTFARLRPVVTPSGTAWVLR